MSTDTDRRRSRLAIPLLLGLMTLAQFGILNEIRYQGCVARYYEATFASQNGDLENSERSFQCSRVPLL